MPSEQHSESLERLHRLGIWGLVSCGFLAIATSGALGSLTVAAVGLALFTWLLLNGHHQRFALSDRWLNALTLCCAGFYPLDYLYVARDFITATLRLVVLLALLRLYSVRGRREQAQVWLAGTLELIAAAIVSHGLVFLACLLGSLFSLSLVLATRSLSSQSCSPTTLSLSRHKVTQSLLSACAAITLLGAIFGTAVFLVLPRPPRTWRSSWVGPRPPAAGLGQELRLGTIGKLQLSDVVYMHVRVHGHANPNDLLWRGDAFSRFDGRQWSKDQLPAQTIPVVHGLATLAGDAERRFPGPRLSYEVRLAESDFPNLFLAGQPEFVRVDAPVLIRTRDGAICLPYTPRARVQYGAYARMEDRTTHAGHVQPLSPEDIARYTQLPHVDKQVVRLTQEITRTASDPAAQAQAIERYLRQNLQYTLELPQEPEPDPIRSFLLERRRGHCEYFASSMAVMLRILGIPSRVAVGFRGGIYNPLSGWFVVRAIDAHSWVEAWIPGKGWVSFDPTPAVRAAEFPAEWPLWKMAWDACTVWWQEWIVSYDRRLQAVLVSHAKRVHQSGWRTARQVLSGTWAALRAAASSLASTWLIALIVLLAVLSAWLRRANLQRPWSRWRNRTCRLPAVPIDAGNLYQQFLKVLARHGWSRPPWMTPQEFAAALPEGRLGELAREFTRDYCACRFGRQQVKITRLLHLLDELERITPHERVPTGLAAQSTSHPQ